MDELCPEEVEVLRAQFDALVEQVLPEVLASAIKLTRSSELAWDCIMEAWWEVMANFPSIRQKEPVPFKVYFLRVLRSKYADWIKHQWNVLPLGLIMEDDPVLGIDFHDPLELETINDERLLVAISHLTTQQRHVLFLCADGYKDSEAALLLRIGVEQYQAALEDARQVAKRELGVQEVEPHEVHPETTVKQRTRPLPQEVEVVPDDDNWLPAHLLANEVNRSRLWVENRLSELGVNPTFFRDRMGRVAAYYPRRASLKLREKNASIRQIGNWLTIPQLSKQLSMDRDWVVSELRKLNIEGEYRLISKSGRRDLCYPPEAADALKLRSEVYQVAPPGWFTMQGLVLQVGQSRGWIERRLNGSGQTPALYRDARGALRDHYPPATCQLLKEMKEEQTRKRNAKKWFEEA